MSKIIQFLVLPCLLLQVMTSCCRTTEEVFDDTKTASRHIRNGFSSLGGKHGDSRQISCRDDFYAVQDFSYENDFIPLNDVEFGNEVAFADSPVYHSKLSPGESGSSIPGIGSFRNPSTIPEAASVFQNVQFGYDSNLIKGEANLACLRRIANYMKQHPNVYVFIEGHCDERGPEAYNLALGARRSNAVRTYLVNEGVNGNNLFTISYGKERPLAYGHDDQSRAVNRRAEFKIYFQ